MTKSTMAIAMIAGAAMSTSAMGAITVTQNAAQNAYAPYSATFDEAGIPVGPALLPTNYYASQGMSSIQSGSGDGAVGDLTTAFGFPVGTGNAYFGNFGVFMNFSWDMTGLDIQVYDPSGAPSPFGGGAAVFVFKDGNQVADLSFTPAWGGVGDEWINIAATGGDAFDEVRILGFGFNPTTLVDNATWTPAPGSLALLGLAGLATRRRRA